MRKVLPKVAIAAAMTLGLAMTPITANAAPSQHHATTSTIVASQAFAAAAVAGDNESNGVATPQVVPAVVATAFITGAASAAGAAVGAWVAGKIIGLWDVAEVTPVSVTAFD